MTRWLGAFLLVLCVATVLSESIAVLLLWSRGQLSQQKLTEIRDVLAGTHSEGGPDDAETEANQQTAIDAVANARAMRVLEFSTREGELRMLMQSLAETRASLLKQRQEFELARAQFQQELLDQQQQLATESVEQGRAILSKLSSEEAVGYLMSSDLENNVLLLKGMSEKLIAKILDEFAQPVGGAEQVERGRQIFEAIYHGAPTTNVINAAAEQLAAGPGDPANQTPSP